MSILNVIVAGSNFVALAPIRHSYFTDPITCGAITYAACASFVSHLFESHKHDMVGFGCSPRLSYFLNRLDVLGVVLLILRLAYISPLPKILRYLPLALACSLLNLYSEHVTTSRTVFVILHSLWHISIFTLLNEFIQK